MKRSVITKHRIVRVSLVINLTEAENRLDARLGNIHVLSEAGEHLKIAVVFATDFQRQRASRDTEIQGFVFSISSV